MRGFGEETFGRDLGAGVGDDEGEAVDSGPFGELETDLEPESAAAAVPGDPGEGDDSYLVPPWRGPGDSPP